VRAACDGPKRKEDRCFLFINKKGDGAEVWLWGRGPLIGPTKEQWSPLAERTFQQRK
jgi:hypothetical protein